MKNVSEALKNLRKVRTGEAAATKSYQVKDDSVLVPVDEMTYETLKRNRKADGSRFIEADDPEGGPLKRHTDIMLYAAYSDDDGDEYWERDEEISGEGISRRTRHAVESKKMRARRRPLQDSTDVPASHRLDALFTTMQTKKNRKDVVAAELDALRELEEELGTADDATTHVTAGAAGFRETFTTGAVEKSLWADRGLTCVDTSSDQSVRKDQLGPPAALRKRAERDFAMTSANSTDVFPDEQLTKRAKTVTQKSPDVKDTVTQGTNEAEGKQPLHSARDVTADDTATPVASVDETPIQKHIDSASPLRQTFTPPSPLVSHASSDPASSESLTCQFSHDGSLLFYMLDLHEDSKSVFLFGKVLTSSGSTSSSCCVHIKSVDRNIYVRPREQPDDLEHLDPAENPNVLRIMTDVMEELGPFRRRYNLSRWMYRPVLRSLVFHNGTLVPQGPQRQMFIKIVYGSGYPPIPFPPEGKTYSGVFGVDTPLRELVLIKRKIKGPMWLRLIHPTTVSPATVSTCKFEIAVASAKDIMIPADEALPPPPSLVILSLSLGFSLLSGRRQEVAMIGALWRNEAPDTASDHVTFPPGSRFMGVRLLGTSSMTTLEDNGIQVYETENALLNAFLTKLQSVDPDIVVGHHLLSPDLPQLYERLPGSIAFKLSRLRHPPRRTGSTKGGTFGGGRTPVVAVRDYMCGRLICDTTLQARDLLRSRATFDLPTLVADMFPDETPPRLIPADTMAQLYTDKDAVKRAVLAIGHISRLAYRLMLRLKMIPLTRELALLSGHLWGRTLLNFRAERNEYLLLHRFHEDKLLSPDARRTPISRRGGSVAKAFQDDVLMTIDETFDDDEEDDESRPSGHKKVGYAGGLVLEPKCGLYDRFILLLDFNSLYPSIIQEYNICFTTVVLDNSSVASVVSHHPGLLPAVLKSLVDRRRQVKAAMRQSDEKSRGILEIRQLALKLTANSMYGCLGFPNSRFFARPIAALITQKGRETLENARKSVESELRLDVVYGDTDSLMIDTGLPDDGEGINYKKALETAAKIKKLVNLPGSHLEMELDGVFARLLLLRKKKYACVKVIDYHGKKFEHESKGLDIVRRDWCGLTKLVGNQVLEILFDSSSSVDLVVERLHQLLRTTHSDLVAGRVPLDLFVITKGLKKLPQHYTDSKNQPHVQVAKRMQALGRPIQPGVEIQYVICESDAPNTPLADRAFHPEEVKAKSLKIDLEWYITTQLLPPIGRLCCHVAGTSLQRQAECLGLSGTSYATQSAPKLVDVDRDQADADDGVDLNNALDINPESFAEAFECEHCHSEIPRSVLRNWLGRFLHGFSSQFYRFKRRCSECPPPALITKRISLISGKHCPQVACPAPRNALVEIVQLKDLQTALDHCTALLEASREASVKTKHSILEALQRWTKRDAHHTVDLRSVFSVFV